jgi:hypothetical protein
MFRQQSDQGHPMTENRELFLTCAPLVQIPVANRKNLSHDFPPAAQIPPLVCQPQLASTQT